MLGFKINVLKKKKVDQELEQILSVDDLEMTAVWKRKRVRLQTTSIGYHK